MRRLKELEDRCKFGVDISINAHRRNDESIYELIEKVEDTCHHYLDVANEIKDKMIATDTVICCYFCPYNSCNPRVVYHYDLGKCLDECLKILSDWREK